jgi:hypothetical protein
MGSGDASNNAAQGPPQNVPATSGEETGADFGSPVGAADSASVATGSQPRTEQSSSVRRRPAASENAVAGPSSWQSSSSNVAPAMGYRIIRGPPAVDAPVPSSSSVPTLPVQPLIGTAHLRRTPARVEASPYNLSLPVRHFGETELSFETRLVEYHTELERLQFGANLQRMVAEHQAGLQAREAAEEQNRGRSPLKRARREMTNSDEGETSAVRRSSSKQTKKRKTKKIFE